MRVKIEEIQAQGLEIKEPLAAAVVEDALKDAVGFKLLKPGELKVKFKKLAGRAHVHGHLELLLNVPCNRCTKDVKLELPVDFELRMVPRSEIDKRSEDERAGVEDDGRSLRAGTFDVDDVDAEPFDGKTIDLDPIVREQVLLALPVSVLCREDCKGLCTVCGQDLNEKDCGCERKVVDVRLAKLKDIKLN